MSKRSIRDCRVAVVGGAGFLGSHLVNHLIDDRGCEVLVVDNLVAGRREFVHPKASFFHHDITGSETTLCTLFRGAAEYVFNYAARPYVPDSYSRPLRTFDVNATGALKVINAAHEAGVKGILQVSSAELYGEALGKIDEQAVVVPHSTYGAAKAAIDALVQVRWREAKVPVLALRQFNCVGERETHPYVLPEILGQLAKQRLGTWDHGHFSMAEGVAAAVKLGNNSQRDFMYAGDAVRAAVRLLEVGNFGEVYNLGSEESVSVYELARLVGNVMGFAEVRVEKDEGRCRPWEIWSLKSCNLKIETAIGETTPVPLEEAVRRTVAWYESNGRRWPWEK